MLAGRTRSLPDGKRKYLFAPQQIRQLGDVHRDPPRFVTGHQMRRRAPSRLILKVDVGERVAVDVADDVAGVGLLGRPGRREAARHDASLYPPASVTRMAGAAASFSIVCRKR